MSRNEIHIARPPEDVFAVLMDPAAYADWVVGSKRIRRTDQGWPQPGSRFHHTLGAGPATLDDNTELVRAEEPRRVELEVRYRPLGVGQVVLELEPDDHPAGTRVVMFEEAISGPSAAIPPAVLDPLFSVRNKRSLQRLARLVEQRHSGHRTA